MTHSMDEIIKTEKPKYHFDIDGLHKHINGWTNMSLKLKKSESVCQYIAVPCVAVELGWNALEFYSDKRSSRRFFIPDGEHSKIRICTIIDFEIIDTGDIYLRNDSDLSSITEETMLSQYNENGDNITSQSEDLQSVNLKNYLTSEAEKKFDPFTHKIYVGDLIWFRTRYYANNDKDRVIDITAVGFVTFYSESEMQITYRDRDNKMHEVSLIPELLRMFDWYLIDENKEYDKR